MFFISLLGDMFIWYSLHPAIDDSFENM